MKIVEEYRNRNVPRPETRKPEPAAAVTERRDKDGFDLYICTECGEEKIAGLFDPEQILHGELRCMVCTGQATRLQYGSPRSRKVKRPAWARDAAEACA